MDAPRFILWPFSCDCNRTSESDKNHLANVSVCQVSGRVVERPNCPKLSDPAHGTRGLQPQRDGRVRCSTWLGGILCIGLSLSDDLGWQHRLDERLAPLEVGLGVLREIRDDLGLIGCRLSRLARRKHEIDVAKGEPDAEAETPEQE